MDLIFHQQRREQERETNEEKNEVKISISNIYAKKALTWFKCGEPKYRNTVVTFRVDVILTTDSGEGRNNK